GQGPGARRPRCLQIISGPSSTADIALNMVYGAHGPRSWLVILIAPQAPALASTAAGLTRVRVSRQARS
ncbi:MAG: LUD domain-containing protein, partial [Chromatocurvus sp.]